MRQIDLSKIIKKYASGWIALSPDYKKVVGHGRSINKAANEAKSKGVNKPIMMRASNNYGPIAP